MRILSAICVSLTCAVSTHAALPVSDDFSNPQRSGVRWVAAHGQSQFADGVAIVGQPVIGQSARLTLGGGDVYGDFAIELKMRFVDTLEGHGHAGIRVRRTDTSVAYIHLTPTGKALLWHGQGFLDYKTIAVNASEWQMLRLVCAGPTIQIYLNGKLEQTLYDVEVAAGGIDLFAHECQVEFDDVKITTVDPAQLDIRKPSRNIVSNSGFEQATAPNLPDYWGTQAWGLANDQWVGRRDALWKIWKRDNNNPYEGEYSMRVDGIIHLATTYVHPRVGQRYTLSAWLRADADGAPVKIIYYNYPDGQTIEQVVNVTSEWARYEVPVDTIDRDRGFLAFHRVADGPFWVDAVQLEQGEHATDYVAGGRGNAESAISTVSLAPTRAGGTVLIDGDLNEPVWREAAWHSLVLADGGAPTEPAEAAIAFDEEALLIAYRCHDSQMHKLVGKITERDGSVWNDDSVEIFLDTAGTRERYFHLAMSVTGAKYDALKIDPSWNAEWSGAVKKEANGWTAEIAIPFKALNLAVQDQGAWRINVARENGKINEVSSVSPAYGSFHNMEHFAEMQPLPRELLSRWLNKPQASAEQMYAGVPFPFDGAKIIPFGLAWQSADLPGPNAFKAMKAAGFTTAVVFFDGATKSDEQIISVLNDAEQNGIGIVYWVGAFGEPTTAHLDKIRYAIEHFKHHPAVRMWMVLDEPHNNPQIVTQAYELAHELDPARPSIINLTSHGLGMRLAGLPGDAIAVDSYGIHFDSTSIADIGPLLRRAGIEATAANRPVLVFIQGMANSLMVWRGPTPAEQTSQTYISLVNGATAIFYFTAFPLAEDTWQRTIELAGEIKTLTPVLLHGKPIQAAASATQIEFTCRELDGNRYLIATNPTANALEVGFDLNDAAIQGELQVLFEGRTLPVTAGQWSDQFAPHSRHVYQLDVRP